MTRKELFIVIAASFWALLLVVGSIPNRWRPALFVPVSEAARATLDLAVVKPGIAVFQTDGAVEWTHRAACLAVFGERADGSREVLYAQLADCDEPQLRLLADRFEVAMHRLLVFASQGEGAWRDGHFATLADYYCHSELRTERPARVAIATIQVHQNIDTGALRSRTYVNLYWDCGASTVLPEPWPTRVQLLRSVQDGGR